MIGASEGWFILCLVFFVLTLTTSVAAVDAKSIVLACMVVWWCAKRQTLSA